MRYYVGVTDNNWFNYLSALKPDEVNFWRPKNQNEFRAITRGDLFLFKLHSPLNYIVGGGFFLKHEFLNLQMTWDVFGPKNGCQSQEILEGKILRHRKPEERNNLLGCTVLVEPFFWDRSDWIPIPEDWSGNIVTGKTYDSQEPIGLKLWHDVQERLRAGAGQGETSLSESTNEERYGQPRITKPRLGQGAFRIDVIDGYRRRCAVTGEKTLPALEAAHIKPYVRLGPHVLSNGILLRSDLHNLFDQGYLTVSLDHRLEVSKYIKQEFDNGRHYYALHGQKLNLPINPNDHPAGEFLEWHHNTRYKG